MELIYSGGSVRFIRARVGAPHTSPECWRAGPVHPRPRGRVERVRWIKHAAFGSSAPAWARPFL
jgi:hypothetical protein